MLKTVLKKFILQRKNSFVVCQIVRWFNVCLISWILIVVVLLKKSFLQLQLVGFELNEWVFKSSTSDCIEEGKRSDSSLPFVLSVLYAHNKHRNTLLLIVRLDVYINIALDTTTGVVLVIWPWFQITGTVQLSSSVTLLQLTNFNGQKYFLFAGKTIHFGWDAVWF